MTAQQAQSLSDVAMTLLLKYSHGNSSWPPLCTTVVCLFPPDPGVTSTLEDLFSVLAKNSGCHANLHGRFLPSAVQLLDTNEAGLPLGLVPVSSE